MTRTYMLLKGKEDSGTKTILIDKEIFKHNTKDYFHVGAENVRIIGEIEMSGNVEEMEYYYRNED